ncbi:hypothetical protein ACNJX9_31515 [Bradyrhizobium sp. DASA03076]|uniref:hypothetical protein n=1 Tax=Bradyrhizobium sp. BLXBL-03 TaxID=3395916 RepID=UPI003F702B1A
MALTQAVGTVSTLRALYSGFNRCWPKPAHLVTIIRKVSSSLPLRAPDQEFRAYEPVARFERRLQLRGVRKESEMAYLIALLGLTACAVSLIAFVAFIVDGSKDSPAPGSSVRVVVMIEQKRHAREDISLMRRGIAF